MTTLKTLILILAFGYLVTQIAIYENDSSCCWILQFEWCQPFRSDDASYCGSNDAILG